ncbi:MAG: KEOPS complex subunit Cgi121 [Candidatus Thermoplasmatota archaeon]
MINIYGAIRSGAENASLFLEELSTQSKKYNIVLQAMNADMIYSKRHILSGTEHAIRALRENRNTMSTLAMELLLYIAGERQIKLAIDKIGVKNNTKKIALVSISDLSDITEARGRISSRDIKNIFNLLKLEHDDSVLKGNKQTLIRFGLPMKEIETVSEDKYEGLILEKVAMVDIIK